MAKFINDWKEYQRDVILTMYPNITEEKLNNTLDKMIDKQMVNPKATLHNNYMNKSIDLDLLSVVDWIDQVKPICAGFGTFFKNQHIEHNPNAVMLDKFLKLRKSYKNKMKEYKDELKKYDKGSPEYVSCQEHVDMYNRYQLTEKVNANSFE